MVFLLWRARERRGEGGGGDGEGAPVSPNRHQSIWVRPPLLISLSPDCLPKTPLQKPFNLGVLHQHLDFEGIQVSL